MNWKPFASLFLPFCLIWHQDAWARWDHERARKLNRYDAIGLEFYNDWLSYQAPWVWDQASPAQVEYRSGAGSLNQKDFIFAQSFRLQTDPEEPWRLSFAGERFEDQQENLAQEFIELSYGPALEGWRLGLLTEGAGDKSLIDLGLSFAWLHPAEAALLQALRLEVWWVDSFYAEKKAEAADSRNASPWSFALQTEHRLGPLILDLHHESEKSFAWTLASRDQLYKAAREQSRLGLRHPIERGEAYFLWQHESLREQLGPLASAARPGYTHLSQEWETGLKQWHGRASSQLSLWGLATATAYKGSNADPLQPYPPRRPGLATIDRREYALFGTWHQPLDEPSAHAQQFGLFINRVYIDEGGLRISSEVKAQWAYDWAIGRQGRFLLGTTWDLDQIARDISLGRKTFRPWGGGFVQMQARF